MEVKRSISEKVLLWQRNIFATMLMLQGITMPSLRFFCFFSDFFKILEVSDFPIGLYGGWQKGTNHHANLWEKCSLLGFFKNQQ